MTSEMDELSGRVTWLIGATGTLGEAMAHLLARRGGRLALSGRRAEPLHAIARAIPGGADVFPMDLKQDASVRSAAGQIREKLGPIELLVVSVAVPAFGEFLTLDDSAFQDAMETKYMGSIRAIRVVLPDMIAQRFGRIVVLSGGGGTFPRPVHLPGGGANAALELVARGLAKRYVKDGVRVNIVAPGPISSPRMRAIADASNAAGEGDANVMIGQPENVAEAICYLLSPRSEFVNGTVLRVDGGMR